MTTPVSLPQVAQKKIELESANVTPFVIPVLVKSHVVSNYPDEVIDIVAVTGQVDEYLEYLDRSICRTCAGSGYIFDPCQPWGMPLYGMCPDCQEQGICPVCSLRLSDRFDSGLCNACGWDGRKLSGVCYDDCV